LITLARWVCAGILLYAAGRQIVAELKKLDGTKLKLDLSLLFLGATLYVTALACFAVYWRQAALQMGGCLGRVDAQRAYFASQLGKYIPGKAWVVFIRCALTDTKATPASVIIASTFYETLVMMATGSLLALVTLLLAGDTRPIMLILSGALSTGFLFVALPPVFSRLATWTTRTFQKAHVASISVSYTNWFSGLRCCFAGWIAAGLSLMAIAGSLGVSLFTFAGFLLACGSMALAIVGGFAVLIVPAGLGVREWILMEILGPSIGTSKAVLVAILTRITHVSVELLMAGGLYWFGNRRAEHD
jgi:glycosyltransferase 2 family protein